MKTPRSSSQSRIGEYEERLLELITAGDKADQDARRELLVLRGDLTSIQNRLRARSKGDVEEYEDAVKLAFRDTIIPTRVLEKQARFCLTSHKYEILLKQMDHVKKYDEEIATYLKVEITQQAKEKEIQTSSLQEQIKQATAELDEMEANMRRKIEEQTKEIEELRSNLQGKCQPQQQDFSSPNVPPRRAIEYSDLQSKLLATPRTLAESNVWTNVKDALGKKNTDNKDYDDELTGLSIPTITSTRLNILRSSRSQSVRGGLGSGRSYHSPKMRRSKGGGGDKGRGSLTASSYHVSRSTRQDDSLGSQSFHDAVTSMARGASLMNIFTGTDDDDSVSDSMASQEPIMAADGGVGGWFGSPESSVCKPSVAGDPSTFGANFDTLLPSASEEKNELDAPLSPTSAALKRLSMEVYKV